jgi:uncharacterized protein (TIGR02145 family)
MNKSILILVILFLHLNSFSQFNCGDTLVDSRDGRNYTTVQIGSQCWMSQNLNYGNMIIGANQTNNSVPEKYCFNNDTNNCVSNGALYQWNELMNYSQVQGVQGLCPNGWHLPTDAEYTTLSSNYPSNPGTALQPGGSSGFNLQFAGYVYYSGSSWVFASQGSYCNLRSSTKATSPPNVAYVRYTYPGDPGFYSSTYPNASGYSARCIKNASTGINNKLIERNSIFISDPFPNPSTNFFTIKYNLIESEYGIITFYDLNSAECFRLAVESSSNSITISTEYFIEGTYFYKLNSSNGVSKTKKITIIK